MNAPGGVSSASFALPPMTQVADAPAVEAWFAEAADGGELLIAAGRVAPTLSMAWMMVDGWTKAKLVRMRCEPDPDVRGAKRWIAVRQRGEDALVAASSPRVTARESGRSAEPLAPDDTPVSDHILRAIKRAANFGQPAPSLSELAKGAGLSSAAGADYYIREKLVKAGKLSIATKEIIGGKRRRYQVLGRDGVVIRQTEWGR